MWSWRPVDRAGGVGWACGAKSLGELRALSRRHATLLVLSRSFAVSAVRAAFWQPWCVFRTPAATSGRVTTPCSWWLGTPRSRRQRLRLQDLSQSFAFRFRDGLVRHLSQARPEQRLADLLASNHALRSGSFLGPSEMITETAREVSVGSRSQSKQQLRAAHLKKSNGPRVV